MSEVYGLSRKQMIEQEVGLSILWDGDVPSWDGGPEEWLICSDTLIIEGLNDTHEGMGEADGYTKRVSVTDSSKGIKDRIGRMVGADYEDFVGEFHSEKSIDEVLKELVEAIKSNVIKDEETHYSPLIPLQYISEELEQAGGALDKQAE